MKELTRAEEFVLVAIWRLKENAYGKTIRKKILEVTGKDYTYGTLYGLLWQLVSKDLVIKQLAPPTPEQGGRGKTYFRLSDQGKQALKTCLTMHNRVWENMTISMLDKG